ncbi:hypothetical protein [Porphyromonas pogonae]|uniref:hypothetical protein n=1 Tax=Porphyromonas pogonae TaxID=867595 RepID=UPI002E75D425|nr:hypothetical protein [Porphyromonas pogonae]
MNNIFKHGFFYFIVVLSLIGCNRIKQSKTQIIRDSIDSMEVRDIQSQLTIDTLQNELPSLHLKFTSGHVKADLITSKDSVSTERCGMDKKLIDSLGKIYHNVFELSERAEKIILSQPRMNADVRRTDKGLEVKLASGEWVTSMSRGHDTDGRRDVFEHYYTAQGYYLIHSLWDEGEVYMLIDKNGGEAYEMFGPPCFSPQGKFALSISSDVVAGYIPSGIQLWEKDDQGKLLPVLTYDAGQWGCTGVQWLNENEAILQCEYQSEDVGASKPSTKKFYAKLTLFDTPHASR